MSDDKKVIFSMSGLPRHFKVQNTSIKKYIFKFLLRSKNWNLRS